MCHFRVVLGFGWYFVWCKSHRWYWLKLYTWISGWLAATRTATPKNQCFFKANSATQQQKLARNFNRGRQQNSWLVAAFFHESIAGWWVHPFSMPLAWELRKSWRKIFNKKAVDIFLGWKKCDLWEDIVRWGVWLGRHIC